MKTGLLIQARLGSSRLPAKVLLDLEGRSVIAHIIERARRIRGIDIVGVATTNHPQDDPLAAHLARLGVAVFRGDEENVLERCIGAVEAWGLDVVVRLGADSPLLDPEVISAMLADYQARCARGDYPEYLSNTLDRSYPIGIDAEIFAGAVFRKIRDRIALLPEEERRLNEVNVIPYLHRHPEEFRICSYQKAFDLSHHRWTLDTPEDYELIRRIYGALYARKPDFLMADILALLDEHPDWPALNSGVKPQSGFWTDCERDKVKQRSGAAVS